MKTLLNTMLFLSAIILLNSCTTPTTDNDIAFNMVETNNFKARFINESNETVDIEVYNVNGQIVEKFNDIKPGDAYTMSSLNAEETTFKISTEVSDRIVVMDIEDKDKYYVVLNEDKQVSTLQTPQL